MGTPKATPMIQQYLTIKEKYKDAILFYRMGDFYEMFFEDAKVASRVLEITLTSRNKKNESAVPMCGIPFRAAQTYIARLIENGFKVAICDQVEDPAQAKGIVKREVVRVVTPGMIIEDELLHEKSNNYILALCRHKKTWGLSSLDLSTGSFRLTETSDVNALIEEIQRIKPSEFLIPEMLAADSLINSKPTWLMGKAVTQLPDNLFSYRSARQALISHFNTLNLEGFGCENLKAGVGAAAALLQYVCDSQRQKITHFDQITTYHLESYLRIDDQSRQNLELLQNIRSGSKQGTLIQVLDQTITSMGGRKLNHWIRYPLIQPEKILQRQEAVAEAVAQYGITQQLRNHLKNIYDLPRLRSKISLGHANARDLLALKTSLYALPDLFALLVELKSELFQWKESLTPLEELAGLINSAIRDDAPPTITEGKMIKTGYSPELDELIQISRNGKDWLVQLEVKEKQSTGINSLKVRYNKVFGYYIEIPKTHSASVPDHYIRKQTLVNAERYITDELKTFETKVLGAEERRAAMELELFNQLRQKVMGHSAILKQTAQFLARLDCLLTIAFVAEQNEYVQPKITDDGKIHIIDGRHPVVEKMITAERFVPNTILLDNTENQVLIITGPNMAGKSTILRQVALMVIMAQIGSFVPAGTAELAVVDRIFTRVGALDNLSAGQSTFMVEMQETANILNHATSKSLVIMDEIGRGTSTFDGLSIAWAVAEYLHDFQDKGIKTLFATHYHELTELAHSKSRVKNFNIAVKEWNDEIIFLRKLIEGGTNRSYGIQVARLAGIPVKVIKRAKKILSQIESEEHFQTKKVKKASQAIGDRGHQQLHLFPQVDRHIIGKLQTVDISRMTPIDALNYLHELQEKSKNLFEN
ncbi:MAG: DNA mismatch repair protein MutS [Desulfobacteraceae bacterium]|jgi:DNA mismatch repair protein MutS